MTFLVATDGKISQVTATGGDTNYEVTFTYEPVTITRPANVQAFPMR